MSEKEMKKGRKALKIVLIVIASLAVVAAGCVIYGISAWRAAREFNSATMFTAQSPAVDIALPSPSPTATPAPDRTASPAYEYEGDAISYKGEFYTLDTDVISVLFLGVDAYENIDYSELDKTVLNANQADTLILLVFNTKTGDMHMLNIPRDTLTDVKVLDAFMQYCTTEKLPIAVQHAYGDGNKLSNQLTMEAVSNLLFNVPVNRYLALNISGISKAADLVDGVTVEMLDDLSAYKKKMAKGETVTLYGADAEAYVRSRMLDGLDGLNLSRMKRQVQFLKAFVSKLKGIVKSDPAQLLSLYNAMSEYYVTNLTVEEVMYLAQNVLDADFGRGDLITTIPGENVDIYYEADDEALKQSVIGLYYKKISAEG